MGTPWVGCAMLVNCDVSEGFLQSFSPKHGNVTKRNQTYWPLPVPAAAVLLSLQGGNDLLKFWDVLGYTGWFADISESQEGLQYFLHFLQSRKPQVVSMKHQVGTTNDLFWTDHIHLTPHASSKCISFSVWHLILPRSIDRLIPFYFIRLSVEPCSNVRHHETWVIQGSYPIYSMDYDNK